MKCAQANDMIAHWAVDHGYPCYRTHCRGGVGRCDALMVLLQYATVYFVDGAPTRITCDGNSKSMARAARELAPVFALCGYVSAILSADDPREVPSEVVSAGGTLPIAALRSASRSSEGAVR
jgi:hypothetical protein